MEDQIYTLQEIEKTYPNWYDPNSELSYDDQKFIWLNTPLPENDSVYENVSGNGSCSYKVNSESVWCKTELILQLSLCTFQTPPIQIAIILEEIFSNWPSKNNHWLWISQRYTARAINQVMAKVVKESIRGAIRTTPAQYFTSLIKHRKKRKELRKNDDFEAKK